MAIFAFDFLRNTHTEASSDVPTTSEPYTGYSLPCCRPSSWPVSILHPHIQNLPCDRTRMWLWVKGNCNHLCFACPRQRRHFLVNNCSETCIRRTLEHSLRVSKRAGFHCLHKKKKTVPQPCLVLKRWCRLKPTRIKKDLYEKKKLPTRLSYCDTNLDMTWSLKKMIKFTSSPASVIVLYSN